MTFDLAAEIKRVTAIQRAALDLQAEALRADLVQRHAFVLREEQAPCEQCEFLNQMETEPTREQLISVVAQHMAEKSAKDKS